MTDDLAAFLVAAEARATTAFTYKQWHRVGQDSAALVGMVRAVLLRHHPETNALAGQPWCYECSTPARALLGKTDWSAMVRGDQDTSWPCATVAALLSAIPPTPTAEETKT